MTQTKAPTISQIEELLASNGYDVSESTVGVLRVSEPESGVAFQIALEGNVLFMTVKLMTLMEQELTSEIMRKMLASTNISTSSFKILETGDGKVAITLNNFCTLQNMGSEDNDDILSLAGYLMADMMEAREMLQPSNA